MRLAAAVLCLSMALPGLVQALTPARPVVLVGASVVQFWTDEHPAFFTDHPDYLDKGRAGEPPSSTVERLAREVLPLNPRVLVFVTGGAATAERTRHDLARFVDLGRRHGAKVVLAASPSVSQENLAAIHDYAAREGLGYADFADMRGTEGRVKPGLTYDGVHPTLAGYVLMEPAMVAAVDRVLANP